MKILVCLSKTPDTTSKISFKENNTRFDEAGVQWIINPYDEWYALVKAIEIKEKDASAQLHLVHVGGADSDAVIRKALALGGDEAIRVNSTEPDSFFVASQIANLVNNGNYDLILTGKETIDSNSSSVGGMIAALTDKPFISLAIKIELKENNSIITKEIEGGEEVNEVELPVVISCQKGVAEQRIPNMRGIMAARTKPLKVVEPSPIEPLTTIVNYELPPAKAGVKIVNDVAELVKLLHEEAKVI